MIASSDEIRLLAERGPQVVAKLQYLPCDQSAEGAEMQALRSELLGLCFPILDDEIRKTSYHYCRHRVRGTDGALRGETEYEGFFAPMFAYIWDRKFEGDSLAAFFGSFRELEADDDGMRFVRWFRRSVRHACIDWLRAPVRTDTRSTGISHAEATRAESVREALSGVADVAARPGEVTPTPPRKEGVKAGAAVHGRVEDEGSQDHLRQSVEQALAELKPRTRAALYLFYCVALPIPDDVLTSMGEGRGVGMDVVRAEVEQMRKPLVARFSKATDPEEMEILAAQRIRLAKAQARIDELDTEAGTLGISHGELQEWEEESARLTSKEIRMMARKEQAPGRRYIRCEYQLACRIADRTGKKVRKMEERRTDLPTPTYAQIGSILGLKEAGATAQVHRGRRRLEELIVERVPRMKRMKP